MSDLESLPYDRVAFKGSHNTIDRLSHLPWQQRVERQLSGTGLAEPCRAIELDLVQKADAFDWSVKHGVNDDGPGLVDVLDVVLAWADRPGNENHPVVTIHFDLKNAPLAHTDFAQSFDGLLYSKFGAARIYRPRDVIGPHPDLVRGARAGGWTTFGALRGRFIFCLSGHGERKHRYARHVSHARACFADYPGSKGAPRKGHRVFANLFVDAAGYRANLREIKRHRGFVARGYNIVHRATWDASIEGEANILSGDVLDSSDLSLGGDGVAEVGERS